MCLPLCFVVTHSGDLFTPCSSGAQSNHCSSAAAVEQLVAFPLSSGVYLFPCFYSLSMRPGIILLMPLHVVDVRQCRAFRPFFLSLLIHSFSLTLISFLRVKREENVAQPMTEIQNQADKDKTSVSIFYNFEKIAENSTSFSIMTLKRIQLRKVSCMGFVS